MPKAARRSSGPSARAEPYPAGDKATPAKPSKAAPKSKKTAANSTDDDTEKPEKPAVTPLAEKRASEVNASLKDLTTDKPASFLDIKLDGEEDKGILIHDTCAVIRVKINSLLGKDNTKPENGIPGEFKKDGTPKPYTKARFLKDCGLHDNTRQLATFLKAKKMMAGAESAVYPAAYMFFEKKRIFEGKKKTAARIKCETE